MVGTAIIALVALAVLAVDFKGVSIVVQVARDAASADREPAVVTWVEAV